MLIEARQGMLALGRKWSVSFPTPEAHNDSLFTNTTARRPIAEVAPLPALQRAASQSCQPRLVIGACAVQLFAPQLRPPRRRRANLFLNSLRTRQPPARPGTARPSAVQSENLKPHNSTDTSTSFTYSPSTRPGQRVGPVNGSSLLDRPEP